MTQADLFGSDETTSTDALRDRILFDALTTEERSSERALKADEAGAIVHSLDGRHDTDTRCLRCTPDGRQALAKLAAHRAGTTAAPAPATRAHARTTDTATSQQAAASVVDLTDRQIEVLRLFHIHGAMNDAWLVHLHRRAASIAGTPWLPQSESGIRTRRAELVDAGLIHDTGRWAETLSHRKSTVWAITQAGRARLTGAAA